MSQRTRSSSDVLTRFDAAHAVLFTSLSLFARVQMTRFDAAHAVLFTSLSLFAHVQMSG